MRDRRRKKRVNSPPSRASQFTIVAILTRRKKVVACAHNDERKHSPRYFRAYSPEVSTNCGTSFCQHAEMAVLRYAQPGDILRVIRYRADNSIACAKPCVHCQHRIDRLDIKVRYTNDDGEWI